MEFSLSAAQFGIQGLPVPAEIGGGHPDDGLRAARGAVRRVSTPLTPKSGSARCGCRPGPGGNVPSPACRRYRDAGLVPAVIRSTGRPCPASKERQAISMRKMQDMLQVTNVEPASSGCVSPERRPELRPDATLRPLATAAPVARETALSQGGGRG